MKHKIAIVVHGRFYAFELAKALLARGNDVHLFTNYPRWAVARFGFPPERVTSNWIHGIASRFFDFISHKIGYGQPEAWLHRSFGAWAARQVARGDWDIVFGFSGVSEELIDALKGTRTQSWVCRGSCHIRAQAELLEAEMERAGVSTDRPSVWMIAREEREYAGADAIVTLSTFASRTFDGTGHEHKVVTMPLGVDVSSFRPTADVIEARRQRVLSDAKLRVLFVGAKSFQKGIIDLVQIARVHAGRFDFRFVGPEEPSARLLLDAMRSHAELVLAVPEAELPAIYEWGDVFIFPTIQDGFAVVLAQANAAGLPIVATTNCGAPDFIRDGETGWIVPIRAPEQFIERLEWCDEHRAKLAGMVTRVAHDFQPRTWDDVAQDFEVAVTQRHSEHDEQFVEAHN